MFNKRKIISKIFSGFLSLFLIFQPLTPALILAQESLQTEQTISEPASEPSEELSVTPSLSPTPVLDENLEVPKASESAVVIDTTASENQPSASVVPEIWKTNDDGSTTTINNVVLNQTYIAPQNDKVTVTFTKLPENPGTLTIKQIILSQEDMEDLGAVSNTAYDITSTMENGTFEYTLTLPTPKTENVEVKASEDGETFVTLGGVTAQEDTLTITGLNHFTVFVVASPSTGADSNSVGTITWSNTGNIFSSDNTYATVILDKDQTSHYLKATNFGLSIPSGAIILGITVEVERKCDVSTNCRDASVKLIKGGAVNGNDKADTATNYPTIDTYKSYGGSTDLWGLTWTPADINSTNFGVAFASKRISNPPNQTISVDHIRVTVYYNTPPVAADDSAITSEDTAKIIPAADLLANDTDVDIPPDTLSVTAVGNAVNGTVSLSGSTVTFTPSVNYNGSGASFEYTLSDGVLTDTGLVTVTVTSVNDPPTISVISPNGGDVFAGGSIRAISWSASDVDTGQTLTISLVYTTDGVSFPTIATGESNDGSYSWFVPSIDSATVKVRVTVCDDVGACALDSSDANFSIDSTASTGTITINDGAEYTNSTSAQLSFTVSETISQMELRNGTVGSFQSPIVYENPHDYTLPAGDGTKTVSVRFTDSAGNKSSGIISDSIILDTTTPSDPDASSTSHTVSQPSSNQTIDIALDGASDNLSGVDGFAYEFNNDPGWICDESKDVEEDTTTIAGLLSEGEWYFHLCTVDNAGNWTSTVHPGPFIIDTSSPEIIDPAITPFNFDTHYLTGTVTVSAYVTDNNSVDNVNFTITDDDFNESSCSGVQGEDPNFWSCEIDTTSLPDSSGGTYDMTIVAEDKAGNSRTKYYSDWDYYFDIDNNAPQTTDTGTDTNWHNSDVTVNFNCEDSGSGCANTYFTTDGTDPTIDSNIGTSVTLDSDGEYTVKYFSVDYAGNTEDVKTAANTVKIDKTIPDDPTSISSTSHTESVWSNDNTVDVSWSGATDNLSGVAGYSYEWDTDALTIPDDVSEGTAESTSGPALADGDSHYLHLRTLDNAGNWTSTVHLGPFFIETSAPDQPQADPAGGDYTTDQSVTLSSSDSGGSGLDKIYYTTDGTTPSNTNGTEYTDPIAIDHSLTLKAIAYDSSGNASSIMSETYGIAPVISAESTSSVSSASITVTWTTDDLATSRVIYDTVSHAVLGAVPNYGYTSSTTEDPALVTSHSVAISGLTAGTTYFYRTVSHGSPETVGSEKSTTTTAVAAATTGDGGGGGGGGNDGGDGLGCAVHDCSVHPTPQNPVVLGATSTSALTIAPAVLGVTTESGNVGIGEEVKGEATETAQPSSTTQPASTQADSPFNFRTILIVALALLLGFGVFKLLVK